MVSAFCSKTSISRVCRWSVYLPVLILIFSVRLPRLTLCCCALLFGSSFMSISSGTRVWGYTSTALSSNWLCLIIQEQCDSYGEPRVDFVVILPRTVKFGDQSYYSRHMNRQWSVRNWITEVKSDNSIWGKALVFFAGVVFFFF